MKRLSEYNLTDEEIRSIFGLRSIYERNLKWYSEDSTCGNDEKSRIAYLLFLRGKDEECRRIIESVEDEEWKRTYRQSYAAWNALPLKMVTSLGLDPLI